MSVSDPNLQVSPTARFSMLPQNHTPSLEDEDSSSSIMITPPPPVKRKAPMKAQKQAAMKAAKKAAKRAVAETVALSDDTLSSDSDATAPPPKRRKKDKGKEPDILCDDQHQLILSVPWVSEPGNQRISFTHSTTFSDALSAIYTTVGCTDVARKPVLTYKLSNAVKSVPETSLQTDSDRKGCLQDMRQAEITKKAGTVIPVMILYLKSLVAKRGRTKLPSGKGQSTKVPVLDLDHAESGDNDFDEGLGTMDQELKFVEELDAHYGHCQACGPTRICKITVASTHHHLSNNQRRAWSQALALKKNGVTLRTPPHDVAGQNLFSMFFKSVLPETVWPVPGPPMQNLLSTMILPQTMGYPYMPWMIPGYSHTPSMEAMHPIASAAAPSHAPHASTSALPAVIPLSDPPEMGALNPYPEIPDFLRRLDGYEPRRNILNYIPMFAALDYYNIDEIHRLRTVEQLVLVAKITHGNATYLMAQVKNEIKKVDRCHKTLF
ncbi:hypothetical protein C8R45DRAFT_1101803 [Mycena sanguinolenta]|nr:hypothetical protein C8R45DRAFT_1101803 [Mycena sanguinolenta]